MRNRSLHMMPASRLTLAAASDDAAQLAERHETLAGEALAEISRTPATTPQGLQAKARIVPAVIKNAAGSPDEREEDFFLSFSADVKAVLQPIIDNEWREALPRSSFPEGN